MAILGIKFPFGRSTTSLPAGASDDDVIADNIQRILLTPRRSRVMRPDSGSDMFAFVFENTGPVLRARIDNEVRRALGAGEPRAEVLFVGVEEQEILSAPGGIQVVVDVEYRVNMEVRRTAVVYSA